ncbi:hypothetical protein Hanom_Chr09g00839151 [Helianthus anomalus]
MIHMSRRVVSHYHVIMMLNVSVHICCECVTAKQVMYKAREKRTLQSGAECHDRFSKVFGYSLVLQNVLKPSSL